MSRIAIGPMTRVQMPAPTNPSGRARKNSGYGRKKHRVRMIRPTGPKVVDPDFHRESVWIFARVGAEPPGRNPSGASPDAGPAGANAEATGIGAKQSPHQTAPGATLAAHPGQRSIDVSEVMPTFIDNDGPRVDSSPGRAAD
jgi:hypothetical protein